MGPLYSRLASDMKCPQLISYSNSQILSLRLKPMNAEAQKPSISRRGQM